MRNLVKVCFAALLSLVLLCLNGCGANHAYQPVTVTLLHTNDTHSQLESYTPFGEPEQGGVARRKPVPPVCAPSPGARELAVATQRAAATRWQVLRGISPPPRRERCADGCLVWRPTPGLGVATPTT